ncbi:hypothetical protein B0O99DRAFT_632634 [Bisporella sp. PMI_857]|nr:hypothetical protein B0O99DRAFT_632634 [Bisporella sp. PMI_857]
MTVPFGFSVGDFIAVGKLVYDIIQAISEPKGAATDYRSFVSTLRSLYSCTNAIKDALEKFTQDDSNFELHEVSLINGLVYEMDGCRDLLNAFLDNTYKYTASFLPSDKALEFEEAQTVISRSRGRKTSVKRLEKAWRKVSWAIFRKEDVQKLERGLQCHLSRLQVYGTFLPYSSLSRVEKSTAEITLVTRKTEVTMMAMFDLLKSVYNMLPPQINDKLSKGQPVFFEDALGRSIELPREFCTSKEKFQRHLEILFEGMPGHDKVAKREYQLEDAAGMTTISADNWHLKVTAGARVAMIVLFQLASRAKGTVSRICPRCDTIINDSNLQQGMTECFNCKLLFDIVDTKHIAELRDDTWHEVGRAVDASNHLGSQQQEKKRSVEQDVFRRIRYFCETQEASRADMS